MLCFVNFHFFAGSRWFLTGWLVLTWQTLFCNVNLIFSTLFLRNNICKKMLFHAVVSWKVNEKKWSMRLTSLWLLLAKFLVQLNLEFQLVLSWALEFFFYLKHDVSLSLKLVPLFTEMREQFIEWNVMLLSTFHRPQKFLPTMQKRLSKMIFKDKQDKNKKGKDPKQQQQQPQQQVQGENTQSKINKQQLLRQQQQQIQVRTYHQKERKNLELLRGHSIQFCLSVCG